MVVTSKIFYEESDNSLSAELECFPLDDGKINIQIKYEKDFDFEARCISLSVSDIRELIKELQSACDFLEQEATDGK